MFLPTLALALSVQASLSSEPSPYAGEEQRQIKALSAQEVQGFLSGGGMGFAKAAELNRYPGPKHVLELGTELNLSDSQRAETQALFQSMKKEATQLGEQLVEMERLLDERFAAGRISSESLRSQVQAIGNVQAQIRFVHLDAHLAQTKILSQEQVDQYVRLRGYDQTVHQHDGHH